MIKKFRVNPNADHPFPPGEIGKIVATEIHKVFDFYDLVVDSKEASLIDFDIHIDNIKMVIMWKYIDNPDDQWDIEYKSPTFPNGVIFYDDGSTKILYTSNIVSGYPISAKIEVTDYDETLIVTQIDVKNNCKGATVTSKRTILSNI